MVFFNVPFLAKGIELKDGDKMAILTGQSFEIWNWSPSGYMRLLTDELARAGVRTAPWICLEGQTTAQMLARLDHDVIAEKPRCALIIPGTADYNPFTGKAVPEAFNQNLAAIVGKLHEANIKTVIATSYAVNSNLQFTANPNVADHNDAIRELAKEHGLSLLDFVKVMDDERNTGFRDGSPVAKSLVNQMFAAEVLRFLGYGENEVSNCRKAWLDAPGAIQFMPSVSVNTYEKLKAAAKAAGKDAGRFMTEVLREKIK